MAHSTAELSLSLILATPILQKSYECSSDSNMPLLTKYVCKQGLMQQQGFWLGGGAGGGGGRGNGSVLEMCKSLDCRLSGPLVSKFDTIKKGN